ncbi:hypothetical protein BpHYR1_039304 [Brachionus plicatilis]|uniref:Uncharacterized protein n=1 Tax=Brachionus plicatilis TaxID=10195 RepID=A0A3M7Q1C0_BRAPC|nr:hypothetical protein BpHYR1_039304 [Brachionus plicatilis]
MNHISYVVPFIYLNQFLDFEYITGNLKFRNDYFSIPTTVYKSVRNDRIKIKTINKSLMIQRFTDQVAFHVPHFCIHIIRNTSKQARNVWRKFQFFHWIFVCHLNLLHWFLHIPKISYLNQTRRIAF